MVYKNRQHNTPGILETTNFIKLCNAKYICGHNFIDFDLEILKDTTLYHAFGAHKVIDTLIGQKEDINYGKKIKK